MTTTIAASVTSYRINIAFASATQHARGSGMLLLLATLAEV
jgi:hypothetical protein